MMKLIYPESRAGMFAHLSTIMVLVTAMACAGSATERKLTVVAGGESHGMVDACNCEKSPGGGVAKRASLLKKLRESGSLLLVDAGGFSAGGIYDDNTAGRAADSVRTLQMLIAMGEMRYDAVAIGDDDLQYGGTWLAKRAASAKVPLVCANCFSADGKPLVKPYVIVKRAGLKIGITSVCTDERLFPLDTTVHIGVPKQALEKIWKKLCRKSDVQIILSHNGSEISRDLAEKFEECDIVVNGHRKEGANPGTVAGSTAFLEFGFQGKSLSSVEMRTGQGKLSFSRPVWHVVTPDLPDDSTIISLVSAVDTVAARNRYDLYIMSQCPYGLEALREFSGFVALNPSVKWDLRFIGTVTSDTVFSSLHGMAEVDDEMVWLAINKLYPDIWPAFCMARSGGKGDTRTIAAKFGVDLKKVDAWIDASGKKEL